MISQLIPSDLFESPSAKPQVVMSEGSQNVDMATGVNTKPGYKKIKREENSVYIYIIYIYIHIHIYYIYIYIYIYIHIGTYM